MADYLGVTDGQIAHVEGRRRSLQTAAWLRLMQLAVVMPPPVGNGPPEPATPRVPPLDELMDLLPGELSTADRAAFQTRLREVDYELSTAHYQLRKRWARATAYARRRQSLALLQATLAAEAATHPRTRAWLDQRIAETEDAALPADCTTAALAQLGLRIQLLETEATALRGWLQ